MTHKDDYIRYKLEKATISINAAEVLLINNFWDDALSKIYYAAFHAVNALLISKGLNPKTHGGAKSLFHKEFVMTGIIDKNFSELYDNLLAKRFEADYEAFALIDKEKLPFYLDSVKEFIIKVKNIVE